MTARAWFCALAAALALAGCGDDGRKPVIPHPAWSPRAAMRFAVAGEDTTRIALEYPDFLGAPTPEALDSLRRAVSEITLARSWGDPAGRYADTTSALEGFIAAWVDARAANRREPTWTFERRTSVAGDTLRLVTLRTEEFAFTGGAHPNSNVTYRVLDVFTGRTLGFDALFRAEALDSLSRAIEPAFRRARGLPPDSSLAEAGFWFENGAFRAPRNVGVVANGVTFRFNAYEVAPYASGPTEFTVPFAAVEPFANPMGPLAPFPEPRRKKR